MRDGPCLGNLKCGGFHHRLGKILGGGDIRPGLVIFLSQPHLAHEPPQSQVLVAWPVQLFEMACLGF